MRVKERGSVEIVILVLVVAIIVGLVAWRIADTQNAQTDAEQSAAMAENAPETPTSKKLELKELGVTIKTPVSAGDVTYKSEDREGVKAARLYASRLKGENFTCEATVYEGELGVLRDMTNDNGTTKPDFTKEVNGTTYGFYSSLQKDCHTEEIVKQFGEVIPKQIVESITKVVAGEQ